MARHRHPVDGQQNRLVMPGHKTRQDQEPRENPTPFAHPLACNYDISVFHLVKAFYISCRLFSELCGFVIRGLSTFCAPCQAFLIRIARDDHSSSLSDFGDQGR
jgi:hypothetical protein